MSMVFQPAAPVCLPVAGSDLTFPVRRIYCVGRNYAAHAVEMGGDPDKEEPFFFQKNPDNLVTGDGPFPYPSHSDNVHHEIEFVVALGKGGTNIATGDALDHVYGYGTGIDMTRRDLQNLAKETRRPWEASKAFEASAPCSALAQASEIGHPDQGAIWLDVDGARRQTGDLNQLIWKVPEIIGKLSELFTLAPGDLIFTGTPSGVGPVTRGQTMHGGIDGVGEVTAAVV